MLANSSAVLCIGRASAAYGHHILRLDPIDRVRANGWNRRISPVPVRPGEGPFTEQTPAVQRSPREPLFMLRVFGRLPDIGVWKRREAGVRKASGEETAGGVCAGGGVYGDLAPVYIPIFGFRTGTTAE